MTPTGIIRAAEEVLYGNADERQTSIWKQRFFADIGDLDKLESELNEIRGTKVLVRRALVLKCCLVFKYV
jgi:hypothetical protein